MKEVGILLLPIYSGFPTAKNSFIKRYTDYYYGVEAGSLRIEEFDPYAPQEHVDVYIFEPGVKPKEGDWYFFSDEEGYHIGNWAYDCYDPSAEKGTKIIASRDSYFINDSYNEERYKLPCISDSFLRQYVLLQGKCQAITSGEVIEGNLDLKLSKNVFSTLVENLLIKKLAQGGNSVDALSRIEEKIMSGEIDINNLGISTFFSEGERGSEADVTFRLTFKKINSGKRN